MAQEAPATEQPPVQVSIPPASPSGDSLSLALRVLGGVAGAAALFAGVGSYVGAQYVKSYYGEVGIPISELQFAPQDYLFSVETVVIFIAAGTAIVFLGLTANLQVQLYVAFLKGVFNFCRSGPRYTLYYVQRFLPGFPYEFSEDASFAYMITYIWRLYASPPVYYSSGRSLRVVYLLWFYLLLQFYVLFIVLFLGLLLVVSLSLAAGLVGIFVLLWFVTSARYGLFATSVILGMAVGVFSVSVLTSWSLRAYKETGVKAVWGRIGLALPFILAVAMTVTVAPPILGAGEARNDLDDRNFKVATFVTIGDVVLLPGDCSETAGTIDRTQATLLCKHENVSVITLNQGRYFVFLENDPDTVYSVPKDAVVSVAYHRE